MLTVVWAYAIHMTEKLRRQAADLLNRTVTVNPITLYAVLAMFVVGGLALGLALGLGLAR